MYSVSRSPARTAVAKGSSCCSRFYATTQEQQPKKARKLTKRAALRNEKFRGHPLATTPGSRPLREPRTAAEWAASQPKGLDRVKPGHTGHELKLAAKFRQAASGARETETHGPAAHGRQDPDLSGRVVLGQAVKATGQAPDTGKDLQEHGEGVAQDSTNDQPTSIWGKFPEGRAPTHLRRRDEEEFELRTSPLRASKNRALAAHFRSKRFHDGTGKFFSLLPPTILPVKEIPRQDPLLKGGGIKSAMPGWPTSALASKSDATPTAELFALQDGPFLLSAQDRWRRHAWERRGRQPREASRKALAQEAKRERDADADGPWPEPQEMLPEPFATLSQVRDVPYYHRSAVVDAANRGHVGRLTVTVASAISLLWLPLHKIQKALEQRKRKNKHKRDYLKVFHSLTLHADTQTKDILFLRIVALETLATMLATSTRCLALPPPPPPTDDIPAPRPELPWVTVFPFGALRPRRCNNPQSYGVTVVPLSRAQFPARLLKWWDREGGETLLVDMAGDKISNGITQTAAVDGGGGDGDGDVQVENTRSVLLHQITVRPCNRGGVKEAPRPLLIARARLLRAGFYLERAKIELALHWCLAAVKLLCEQIDNVKETIERMRTHHAKMQVESALAQARRSSGGLC